jgi:hypothetical protein
VASKAGRPEFSQYYKKTQANPKPKTIAEKMKARLYSNLSAPVLPLCSFRAKPMVQMPVRAVAYTDVTRWLLDHIALLHAVV